MGEVNSVVETAVKRTSWGKSRNELLCCFHNSAGLHRISGDAPLETRILTHEGNHVDSRIIDNSTCGVDVNAKHKPEDCNAMHCNSIPGVVKKLRLDGRSTSGIKFNGANTDIVDPPPYCHIFKACLLYTSPSPRDLSTSRMPSSA